MKTLTKICTLFLLILSVLTACGKTPQEELVGYWEKVDGTHAFKNIEFFNDGTYVTNRSNYEGDYSISNDRIKFEGVLVDSKTYTYKVDDDTLTFYNTSDEVLAVFERTN